MSSNSSTTMAEVARGQTTPDSPTSPMSQTRFYKLIAAQNQNKILPFLLNSSSRVKDSISTSSLYHYSQPLPPLSEAQLKDNTAITIDVVPIDTLDCARALVGEGKQAIVVLNMANAGCAGGAYLAGAGAQEEALCRRSTLYLTLCREDFYPIPDHGGNQIHKDAPSSPRTNDGGPV